MLEKVLADLSKSFTRTDVKTVVCHPSDDNRLRVSCHTDDKQLYIYGESKDTNWNEKEFAFRDWTSISSIISSFYNSDEPESCVMKLEKNDEDYPSVLKVKNGSMKLTHYLQNYTFISKQDDLLVAYKGKRFTLKSLDKDYMEEFTQDTMSRVSKLSSLTGEKYFKVKKDGDGLFFCFGDESKTIDNAKICVQTKYDVPFTDKDLYFSVDYLGIAFGALKDSKKMKFDGGTIVICGDNDVTTKVIALVGKKEL